jgi:hypothetical protein
MRLGLPIVSTGGYDCQKRNCMSSMWDRGSRMERVGGTDSGCGTTVAERPHRVVGDILLRYEWCLSELDICVMCAKDFRQFLANLRERLLDAGLIDKS